MSEIVVGSWVGVKGAVPSREGRVTEVKRRTGEPYALDEVCVVTADGTAYDTVRGSLMLVDDPAVAPRMAAVPMDPETYQHLKQIDTLAHEVNTLEQEVKRLVAFEFECGRLTRELESERRARTAASQSLDHERQVAYNALRDAETQGKRADVWQAATADALAQAALWRDKYDHEHQECVRMHERLVETQGRVVEMLQSKGVHDGE